MLTQMDAYDAVLNSDSMRGVLAFFAALDTTAVVPSSPPDVAPMVQHMLNLFTLRVDANSSPTKVNWWRSVSLLSGDVEVVALLPPRLRRVRLETTCHPNASLLLRHLARLDHVTSLRVACGLSDYNLFKTFRRLRSLTVFNVPMQASAAVANQLAPLNLTSLSILDSYRVGDLRGLAKCRSLTALHLRNVGITVKGLEGLDALPALQTLDLRFAMSDERFRFGSFGRARALTSLSLANVPLERDGLRGLEDSSTLRHLALYGTGDLCDIGYLATLPSLAKFEIGLTEVQASNAVEAVCGMASLTELSLSVSKWCSEASTLLFRASPCLRHLRLFTSSTFETVLRPLKQEQDLKVTTLTLSCMPSLTGGNTTDEHGADSLDGIEAFRDLTSLSLCAQGVRDESLVPLRELPTLAAVYILGTCIASASALSCLVSVRTLHLSSCSRFTNEGVHHVSRMPSLTDLSLSDIELLTDVGPVLKEATHLKLLRLESLRQLGDAGFGTPSPTLRSLTVVSCPLLSPQMCPMLAEAAATLQYLCVRYMPDVELACQGLHNTMPRTRILVSNNTTSRSDVVLLDEDE